MFSFDNHNELVKPYRVIVESDPALDTGDKKKSPKKWKKFQEAMRQYIDNGDPSVLPLKGGQKPSVWVMEPLRGKALVKARKAINLTGELMQSTGSSNPSLLEELNYELCRMSLRAVENIGEEGEEYDFATTREAGIDVVAEEEMARVFEIKPRGTVPFLLGLAVRRRVVGSPLS